MGCSIMWICQSSGFTPDIWPFFHSANDETPWDVGFHFLSNPTFVRAAFLFRKISLWKVIKQMDSRSILGRTFDVTTYQDLRTFDTCFDLVFGWWCRDRWWISHGPLPNKFKLKPPLPIDLPLRDFKGPSPTCWVLLTCADPNPCLNQQTAWQVVGEDHLSRPPACKINVTLEGRPVSSAWLKILAPCPVAAFWLVPDFPDFSKILQSQSRPENGQKPSM